MSAWRCKTGISHLKYAIPPKGRCKICGENAYGYHHIVPKSAGGSEGMANKVLLCERCHDIVEEMADNGEDLTPRAMTLIKLRVSEDKGIYKV